MHQVRFRVIRLVEQTEQKLRRIRVCLEEKQKKKDCNSWTLLFYKLVISQKNDGYSHKNPNTQKQRFKLFKAFLSKQG